MGNAVLATLALFVVLEGAAMILYPGGTCWDPAAHGHRFWENFLCDLEWSVARNGMPNPTGSLLAEAAMILLALSLAPHWILVGRVLRHGTRLGGLVRGLGLASVAGSVLVNLLPSNRFGVALHGAAVVVAGLPGLSATALSVVGLRAAEARPRVSAMLGGALLVVAFADFVLYLGTFVLGGPGPLALPAAQKIALMLLLAWMASVALGSRRTGASVQGV